MTDQELAELMKRAVAEVYPADGALVTRAEQRGRRLRRRRLAWIAGGNAAAVAAIVVLAATLTHLPPAGSSRTSGSRPGIGPAASTPSQAAPSASPTATPAPGPPMTSTQMLAVLSSMLPANSVFTDVHSDTAPGALEVNYNDGSGPVDIMIDISPTQGAGRDGQLLLSCPNPLWTDEGPRPAGALPISCQMRTLPDGSIERDAVMYADAYGFYGYDIYDQRPDGVQVFIQVANGYFDPYLPHVDRATPPGSMALWETVVESPAWHE